MKPQDVTVQLIGTWKSWNDIDMFVCVYDTPSKFPWAAQACVDYQNGVLTLQSFDPEGSTTREEKYSIKATLEPYEEPDDQENS